MLLSIIGFITDWLSLGFVINILAYRGGVHHDMEKSKTGKHKIILLDIWDI